MSISTKRYTKHFKCHYCGKGGPVFDSDHGYSGDKGWKRMFPLNGNITISYKDERHVCPDCIKRLNFEEVMSEKKGDTVAIVIAKDGTYHVLPLKMCHSVEEGIAFAENAELKQRCLEQGYLSLGLIVFKEDKLVANGYYECCIQGPSGVECYECKNATDCKNGWFWNWARF